MLRLKVRVERADGSRSIEVLAIANSGFIGLEPEILLPINMARELRLDEIVQPEAYTKITGDGREVALLKYRSAVKVYVVTEDRVEGPVVSSVLILPNARYALLNDKLLGRLKIVLLDFGEGIWCFRDEIGRRQRRSY